ncbi:MAG: AMP-binding protein [Bdellovibrionales bacterium]
MNIDWEGKDSRILENPNMPQAQKQVLDLHREELLHKDNLMWFQSSGTTSKSPTAMKWIGLTRDNLLSSANAVNQWIQSDSGDTWLMSLPEFHVGGLSILARAHLTGANVVQTDGRWDPQSFIEKIEKSKVTICSLVPTQVYDLIRLNLRCPKGLRVVFVGGGRISENLYALARKLDWPVLITYGMTEAASQIATASISSLESDAYPNVHVLPHLDCSQTAEGRLILKGPSVTSVIAQFEDHRLEFQQYSNDFVTDDIVELSADKKYILSVSRVGRTVKTLGELADLDQLQNLFNQQNSEYLDCHIWYLPDSRKENEIVAVSSQLQNWDKVQAAIISYNLHAPKWCRIDKIYYLKNLPKSPLGKILWGELSALLS